MKDDVPLEIKLFLKNDPNIKRHIRIFSKKNSLEDLKIVAVDALIHVVKPFYEDNGVFVNYSMYNFLVEPLKNTDFYGVQENSLVNFGLLLSKNGIVASYNDGGNYFKKLETKQFWQERKTLSEKEKININSSIYGVERSTIFEETELMHIDADKGTLYTGISTTHSIFS